MPAHTKPLLVIGRPSPVVPTGVTTLRKTGDAVGLVGDIVLNPGLGVYITESGQVFTISIAPGATVALPVWQFREVPAGTVNGSNAVFTLALTPVVGSEHVFLNGLLQQSGAADYSITGGTITFVAAPLTGDRILVTYQSSAGSSLVSFAPSLDFSIPSNSQYVPLVF